MGEFWSPWVGLHKALHILNSSIVGGNDEEGGGGGGGGLPEGASE